jgi:2-polyprenyl-6-methoxyphenol hydroxylase-like FAD-dependent oxidoreductase
VVLEKHADFLRDFRGDTVHPSTLEVVRELGLLDEFLKRPHQELRELSGVIGGVNVKLADFSHVPAHCKFIALMPQWDFLDFLSGAAKRYANFRLLMQAEVTDLTFDGDIVTGVRARTPGGALSVHADLVVGADGRHSTGAGKSGTRARRLRRADRCVLDASSETARATRPRRLAASPRASSSSRSIAAITGNAPSSFPRAAPMRSGAPACRNCGNSLRAWRPNLPIARPR